MKLKIGPWWFYPCVAASEATINIVFVKLQGASKCLYVFFLLSGHLWECFPFVVLDMDIISHVEIFISMVPLFGFEITLCNVKSFYFSVSTGGNSRMQSRIAT